ncbi:hypothetical protein TSUD_352240 [Trifolium subterraneum]|nr:hypothetical protein TSUD_352240 [Trifolium subterraneum]
MSVDTKPRWNRGDSNKKEQVTVKHYPPNVLNPKVAPITSVGHTGVVCRISDENLMVKTQHGNTYLDLLDRRPLPGAATTIGAQAQHSWTLQRLEDNLVKFYWQCQAQDLALL